MPASTHPFGTFTTGVVAAAALCLSTSAFAGLDYPAFLMTWDVSNDGANPLTYDPAAFGSVNDNNDGTWTFLGSNSSARWSIDWDVLVDPNWPDSGGPGPDSAQVNANIQVTNNSDQFETFSLLMVLPINAIGPSTDMNGSAGLGVSNNQIDGDAIMRPVAGESIYEAYIDVVDVNTDTPARTLFGGAYQLSAGPFFGQNTDNADFGNPTPEPGPGANDNIAILLEFELSAGDSASITSQFQIVATPAPGALSLMALCGIMIGGRRRRK